MLFRMAGHGGVLPPAEHTMFHPCAVGISFAVRMELWREHELAFCPSPMEDYALLLRIHAVADLLLAAQVVYFVRDRRPAPGAYPEHLIARSPASAPA
jgi:hypothetical protein